MQRQSRPKGYIRFLNTVNFGMVTHKGLNVPDVLTILEKVIPCLHTGDCYNMSDESTEHIQDFDQPPYSLTEIRYELLLKNYYEPVLTSRHRPRQCMPHPF